MRKFYGGIGVVILCFFLFLGDSVYADSTRTYGYAKEVVGDVTYQTGASAREYSLEKGEQVYAGNVLVTGKDAFVELYLPRTDDTFYVGENSKLFFDKMGESLVLHIVMGQVYVSAGERDKEAPLIVKSASQTFKVVGTHFFVNSNPNVGFSTLHTFAGIVEAALGDSTEEIYPTQQYLNLGMDTQLEKKMAIDPNSFASNSQPIMMEAMLRNHDDILEENKRFVEAMSALVGPKTPEQIQLEKNIQSIVDAAGFAAINAHPTKKDEFLEAMDQSRIDQQKALQYLLNRTQEEKELLEQLRRIQEQEKERQLQRKKELAEKAKRYGDLLEKLRQENVNRLEEEQQKIQERLEQNRLRYMEEYLESLPTPTPTPTPTPDPDPDPDPDPAPVPGEISITAKKITSTEIQFSWTQENGSGNYEILLENTDGTLREGIFTKEKSYTFKGLSESSSYTVVVKSGEKVDKYPFTTLKYVGIEANYADGGLWVEIYDEDGADGGYTYEIWLNGEIMSDAEQHENTFFIPGKPATERFNKVEVYSYLVEERVGHGYTYLENDSFAFLDIGTVNPTSAIAYWLPPIDTVGYNYQVNLKATGEPVDVSIKQETVMLNISGLAPETAYELVVLQDDTEKYRLPFTTSRAGSIDLKINGEASWKKPTGYEGEELYYEVFVNGKQVNDGKITSINLKEEISGKDAVIRVNIFDTASAEKPFDFYSKSVNYPNPLAGGAVIESQKSSNF